MTLLFSKKFLGIAFTACLVLLVVGAKWATLDRFGSPMPDWDQWDAEAVELFIPWYENDHFTTHLFKPHNEHRVVLTKLQNLTLGVLNGQWDSRLEAGMNALLHAALAAGFWIVGRRWIAARWHALLFVVIAALFALPLAWQNVLGGFHSQQYWLLGLSFLAIVVMPFARTWSAAWWAGLISAILAIGSMGSGFLAAAVILVIVAWRLWTRESTLRHAWPTLLFTTAIVVFGFLTRHEVAWHAKLKATTAHDFFFSIIHSLQWPWRERNWAAAVLWIPWAMVVWRVATHRTASDEMRPGQTIVGLGGWVLIQIVATAYARGAGADYPASRYMDTLAFGALVNALALGWLIGGGTQSLPWHVARYSVGLAWLATFGCGVHFLMSTIVRYELVDARKYYVKAEGHMSRYLGTNDPKALAFPDIPYPSAQELINRLARPSLRALMPLPIRTPLALVPAATTSTEIFRENDARGSDVEHPPREGLSPATPPLDATKTWGSFTPGGGATATGEWRSAPLPPPRAAWLKFELAGHAGLPGVALELRSAGTDELLATVAPTKVPGDTWRAAYVRTPREPFVVAARDADPARWLAFSGPTEMGALSYWAARTTKHGLLIVYLSSTATIALCAMAWWASRTRPE